MNKIPRAEEVASLYNINLELDNRKAAQAMIGFAKLHVEAALKAASENFGVDRYADPSENEREIKKDILNAYPLTNIV